jgi:hypothetical protein
VFCDAYDFYSRLKNLASDFVTFPELTQLFVEKVLAENTSLKDIFQGKLTEYEDDMEMIRKS